MSFAGYLHRDDTILRGRMIECFQTIKWFNNLCLKISYTLKACFNSENVIEVCTFFVTPKTKAKHKVNALKKCNHVGKRKMRYNSFISEHH